MKLELVCIKNNVIELLRVVDLKVDSNSSLVSELSAKLEVVEREIVVGRLDPDRIYMSVLLLILMKKY